MAKRAYELLVRFGENETVAGAHVKEMHLDEDGKDLRETAPIPLANTDNPVFVAFADKFAAKTVAENESLKSTNATLTTEKEKLESEKTSLTSQLAAKTEQAEKLTEEKTMLAEQLAAANARIAALLQDIPFTPRIIDATAFYNRLTKDEILTLFASTDATTKQIGETILQYKTNDWPIVFESTEVQQMLGYLMQAGTLTESRTAELTRDATRAEAYSAE